MKKKITHLTIILALLLAGCSKAERPALSVTDSKTRLAATVTQVSVKDFGAVGNGSTDDTQAIITAMNYAKTNGVPTVYFPYGTYWNVMSLFFAALAA